MKQECAITRDLLPLYLEGLAGPESAAFVRRHLEQCPDCRAEQERLFRETPREPELPVKRLRKLLLREKYVRLLAAVLAALAVAAAVFSRLSAPEYLSAGQAAPETAAVGDALCIVFSPAVRHVSCVSWTDETGVPVYQLEAWTTLLDGGEPQAGRQSVTLPRQKGMIVFYAQNNGQDDALLYGTAADAGDVFDVVFFWRHVDVADDFQTGVARCNAQQAGNIIVKRGRNKPNVYNCQIFAHTAAHSVRHAQEQEYRLHEGVYCGVNKHGY